VMTSQEEYPNPMLYAVGVERLIDANLNRLKEGIRVIEDICRYLHNDAELSHRFKLLRHSLQSAYDRDRLTHRDIESDVQKISIESEQLRGSIEDLMVANFSRAQESSRVLEEVFKLKNIPLSEQFKATRYELYGLEKQYFQRFA